MNNDLGFIILFIVIPTILVVSGFWLIVIVRGDIRVRGASTVSDGADDQSRAGDSVLADPELSGEQSAPTPIVAAGEREEFWTPAEEPGQDGSIDAPDVAVPEITTPEELVAQHTTEVNIVDDGAENSGSARDDDNSLIDVQPEIAATDDGSSSPKPRKSTPRMVPSTDNVTRRTGQPLRRTPPIPRSGVGEKDPVERTDSV